MFFLFTSQLRCIYIRRPRAMYTKPQLLHCIITWSFIICVTLHRSTLHWLSRKENFSGSQMIPKPNTAIYNQRWSHQPTNVWLHLQQAPRARIAACLDTMGANAGPRICAPTAECMDISRENAGSSILSWNRPISIRGTIKRVMDPMPEDKILPRQLLLRTPDGQKHQRLYSSHLRSLQHWSICA